MAKFDDKVNGNTVDATEYNNIVRSPKNAILAGGIAITSDNDQLAKSIVNHVGASNYYTDSGAANAYVLSTVGSFKAPTQLDANTDGLLVRFRAANASTTASTINVAGLGAVALKLADGTTDITNEITTDKDTFARYDHANTAFILTLQSGISSNNPNLIINGQGTVAQRGTTFDSTTTPANSDDTYLLDRMLYLSSASDAADISQETITIPVGSYSAIKFDQETANEQWGYVQILEAKDAAAIIGGTASLSFKARKGGSNTTLETLRAAIISWDGAEDSVTSDVVSGWAGAGTNPTLAANWTYENTPSDLTLTTSYQTFKIENIAIDTASTKNVAVFIWLDDIDATVADTAFITDIKLEKGSVATDFVAKPIEQELALCQRYYYEDPAPSINTEGYSTGSAQTNNLYCYPTTLRVSPSVTSPNFNTVNCGVPFLSLVSVNSLNYSGFAAGAGRFSFTYNSGSLKLDAEL